MDGGEKGRKEHRVARFGDIQVEQRASLVAQTVKNLPAMTPPSGRTLEKEIATLSSILACNSVDRGAWWATVYGVTKSRIQLSD